MTELDTASPTAQQHRISTDEELTALLGEPTAVARDKVRTELLEVDR